MQRLLLDTQAFIVAGQEGGALSQRAKAAVLNKNHELYLSLISIWEMQIKISLGKLKLPSALSQSVQRAITELGLELLPLRSEHIYELNGVPFHHRDPFDRLLVAQARYEKMPIISNDGAFDAYDITRIW